jgi:hypothetical protein
MSPTRSASFSQNRLFDYGYRLTSRYAYQEGPTLGAAMAISGAAVNPNRGHHSSAATAFLLTIFNVRLGWWIGNPRLDSWRHSDPPMGIAYVISDLMGKSDINSDYVCLSDGGHFDNMGLYELIRRRCHYIILGDAEQDANTTHQGLANAIRRCWIDFGVKIEAGFEPLNQGDKHLQTRTSVFTITYPEDLNATGTLVYVKSSMRGNLPIDIEEYHAQNPEFPQESTSDQFFNEAQFESYRKLGYHALDDFEFALPGMVDKD